MLSTLQGTPPSRYHKMKGIASGHYSMAMTGRNGCGNEGEREGRHLSVRMMMMTSHECNPQSDQADKTDVGRVTAVTQTDPSYSTGFSGEEVSHLIPEASVCASPCTVRVHSPPSATRASTVLRIRSRGSQLLRP
jgi:hypothetical protein